MSCISLLTDFGLRDGNVGVMRGIIWGIAPHVQVADLSHQIGPQNILEGAFVLGRHAPYFPPETVHIGVVDPGVGTQRRPIAACLGDQYFVGPDNGLVTLLLEWAEQNGHEARFVHLTRRDFWLPQVSHVFHGRDIFAPVAAHLANGVALEQLGQPISNPVRLAIPRPQPVDGGWQGELLYVDSFGNLITNFRREDIPAGMDIGLRLGSREVRGLVNTFGQRSPGDLVLLFGSTGSLLLAEVNGSAQRHTGAQVGDRVEVFPISPAS